MEEPSKAARKWRVSEEIIKFDVGDVEDPTSPHGQALE